MVIHSIPPVFNENSRILILGTMPSPKSREAGFYYMHPRNRFWMVMGEILGEEFPEDAEGKRDILLRRRIALWDVLKSCEIKGASDASIKGETPNDLDMIFKKADIKRVYVTGRTAEKMFLKHFDRECRLLYSPSPANCAISIDRMIGNYAMILEDIND